MLMGEGPYFGPPKVFGSTVTVGGQVLAADGAASAPSYAFSSSPSTGMYRSSGSNFLGFTFSGSAFAGSDSTDSARLSVRRLGFGATIGSSDTLFERDAISILNLRNSTTAQQFRVSETYTDINNRAGLSILAAAGGPYVITPEAVGTGVLRGLQLAATSGLIGFMGATPVVRQTDGAGLTNNVTVGGTTNQVDDFTNLTVYATDAGAIRNDIYQLAKKLKIVDDALRLYGLLT